MAGWSDELKRRLPEIVLSILAAKQGGTQALGAFQGGVQDARAQQQQWAQQQQGLARQAQMDERALSRQQEMDDERRQQQQVENERASETTRRSDEAAKRQQMTQALSAFDKYTAGVSETATDAPAAENAILARGAQLESSFGVPQGQLTAFTPSLTKPISDRKAAKIRGLAKAKLEEVSKVYPQEAIASGSARFSSQELANVLGDEYPEGGLSGPDLMKYAELDARTAGGQAVPPMLGKVTAPPTPGSFEDFSTATPERKAQIAADRKVYMQADDKPTGGIFGGNAGASDINEIADAIISGKQPPTLTGFYGKTAEIRAALARKGYNLTTAGLDYTATQAHFRTLNGAQQTRMRQAVDNAYHSLDVIDDLASQWKGGKFPALNKGRLLAAKQGAMGPEAQRLATALDAQIADVTSELANVYMGGNSPTDHALSLASKNLSADWSEAQLKALIAQSRTNLKIRLNSIANTGVVGVSPTNPYAPSPVESAAEEWVRDANGKLVKKAR